MNKQLLRSKKNRMIGGVAGGIADYFDIDPVIIRAIFIVATLGWGLSILVYIILWIIVPDEAKLKKNIETEPEPAMEDNTDFYIREEAEYRLKKEKSEKRKILGAVLLITIGAALLFENFAPFGIFENIWPLAIIALGIYILFKDKNHRFNKEVESESF